MGNETGGHFQLTETGEVVGVEGMTFTEEGVVQEITRLHEIIRQQREEINFILRQVQDRLDAQSGERGTVVHQANIDLNENKLVNVADPTNAQDGATKNWAIDTFAQLEVVAETFQELKKIGLPITNLGGGLSESTLLISNEPTNGKILVANSGSAGGYSWRSPHEIHSLVSGVGVGD